MTQFVPQDIDVLCDWLACCLTPPTQTTTRGCGLGLLYFLRLINRCNFWKLLQSNLFTYLLTGPEKIQ